MAFALSEYYPKLPTEPFEPAESDQFNADLKSASGTVFHSQSPAAGQHRVASFSGRVSMQAFTRKTNRSQSK